MGRNLLKETKIALGKHGSKHWTPLPILFLTSYFNLAHSFNFPKPQFMYLINSFNNTHDASS